ncbi:MAG: DUF6702 family protein [Flammeovirgaceae bacterium]
MKAKLFSLFLLAVLPHFTSAHTFNVAYFDISEDVDGYHLGINFDKESILAEIQSHYPHLKEINGSAAQDELEDCLAEYIMANLDFSFDQKAVQFTNWSFEQEALLTHIYCDLYTKAKQVKSIKVRNTCLTHNKQHNNIIRAALYDKSRYFRLSAERLETTIAY